MLEARTYDMLVFDGPKHIRGWDPLRNDGDAFRLAVKLRLEIDIHHTGIAVRTPNGVKVLVYAEDQPDAYSATRLAIVRAAAALDTEAKP